MRAIVLTLLASAIMASDALAQRRQRLGAPQKSPPAQGEGRAQLEGQVRREFARAVRNRVGLNDAQMEKLGQLTQRYEEQRRRVQIDERDARMALQGAILGDAQTDSANIEQLLEKLLDVQRRRFQLMEAEQKEMAGFMTPLQRAKYLAMQEQVRRRLEQLRPQPGAPFGDGPPTGRARRPVPPDAPPR